ncbi:hypothetical protein ASE85_01775 [Sphingobium sp. Leaf26]|uniref:hypothetical protein n=1 Tax=Sphingobium sp. Leaf26 TaxID=1735693 RepID=UPI0006FFE070|nr:hypothetical protein [Sphingobium sp. Leaf26]KQN09705.1 hypothetical protein ASE85_01775 [Sphingobium sp. Leaf26]
MKHVAALLLALGITPQAMAQHHAASTQHRAAQRLGLPAEAVNVTPATWNGRPWVFADYLTGSAGEEERQLVILDEHMARPPVQVTVGEQEGGAPRILAIGFANADRDKAKELIVLLAWDIRHYDVSGTMYGIRILDDWKPGQKALVPVKAAERLFKQYACDCGRRDGPDTVAKVKTIAAVKQVLKRAGY